MTNSPPSPTSSQISHRKLWTIYLTAAAFLFLRTPYEVLHGLVEGEEGTVYLRYAWDAPPVRALFAPHQGYYSLLPNLCGLIATHILPLEQAGHFFVLAELAIHLLLVYMLAHCEAFTTVAQKSLAVAVGLLTVPTVAIVLCTDNAQFFLAIVSAAILISNPVRLRIPRLLALIFAGLNGVLSCVLLPFFLLRAWQERTRARIFQAAALAVCTVIQAAAVLSRHIPMGRHSSPGFFAAAFLANSPLAQFFTHWSATEACRAVGSPKLLHWQAAWWLTLELAAALYLGALLFTLWRSGRTTRILAAGAILSLMFCLARGGTLDYDLMCGSGARYFFTFNLISGLALVVLAKGNPPHTPLRFAARALVVCSIVSGALDLASLAHIPHSPIWSNEVALWRADPTHALRIGPGAWPGVKLTPQPGRAMLPANIYDSTQAGWQER